MELVAHVERSIKKAYDNCSPLTDEILSIYGMSGNKTRHLYNNMCSLPNARYLEVGTYQGSSFICAMYQNKNTEGYCVDNWSQFDGDEAKKMFYKHINDHLHNDEYSIKIIDKDCWQVTQTDIPKPINIFMYDGDHSYESQKKAMTYFKKFFDKHVIIMVDDWVSNNEAKPGTMEGIQEAGLKILFKHEIGLVNTDKFHQGGDTFWNGCGIFICECY